MGKTYIFGHKNPDTDSIVSSLLMANLEKSLGNDGAVACRTGKVNKESEYVLKYAGTEAPMLIENLEAGSEVIVVDTANEQELPDNINDLKIKKIVDHHYVALRTSYPLYYRAEPVGCTSTIMYKLYKENNVEISKTIATLMLSAIISDTLLFKSPTCTDEDVKAVKELAKIADLDYEKYGLDMLKAGTDLSSFSIDEILCIDAKETKLKDIKTVINQVNTAYIPDVMKMQKELEEGINKIIEEKGLDLFVLLITDIVNSNSQVIALGKNADLVEKTYGVKLVNNTALLEGVVSRKKQVIPPLTENA